MNEPHQIQLTDYDPLDIKNPDSLFSTDDSFATTDVHFSSNPLYGKTALQDFEDSPKGDPSAPQFPPESASLTQPETDLSKTPANRPWEGKPHTGKTHAFWYNAHGIPRIVFGPDCKKNFP
jgi:hypothetical protein